MTVGGVSATNAATSISTSGSVTHTTAGTYTSRTRWRMRAASRPPQPVAWRSYPRLRSLKAARRFRSIKGTSGATRVRRQGRARCDPYGYGQRRPTRRPPRPALRRGEFYAHVHAHEHQHSERTDTAHRRRARSTWWLHRIPRDYGVVHARLPPATRRVFDTGVAATTHAGAALRLQRPSFE